MKIFILMESEWLAGRQSQIQILLTYTLVKQGVFQSLSLRNKCDGSQWIPQLLLPAHLPVWNPSLHYFMFRLDSSSLKEQLQDKEIQ